MANIVRCAIYSETVENEAIHIEECCKSGNLISSIACTREQLDFDVWKIVGNKEIDLDISTFANERFRTEGWVGAKIYDAAIIEEFANAFHGLLPWDDFYDPNYLDKLLIDITKKPNNLIFIKQ